MTWADDGHLYTCFGDGWGFDEPPISEKLSMGWARVEGPSTGFTGRNIRSADEQFGNGASGKKCSGMLSVNGRLYLLVQNANNAGEQCELWYSDDHGVSWTDAGWNWPELGYCAFLNFGQDCAAARDNYVYLYSPDSPSAYIETDAVVLARAPKDRLYDQTAWEYFAGMSGNTPLWSSNIADRVPIFEFPGGSNRLDVTYNASLGRYLMTMRARDRSGSGNPNHFSIYDAPEPWGPWTTVYYTETSLPDMSPMDSRAGGWGESQHIPSKWISSDGLTFYLVYSGDDSFRTRRGTLILRSPSNCGDGIRQPGEQCDGTDMADGTCVSLGYEGGELSCTETCTYDTSACYSASPPAPENLWRTDRRPTD